MSAHTRKQPKKVWETTKSCKRAMLRLGRGAGKPKASPWRAIPAIPARPAPAQRPRFALGNGFLIGLFAGDLPRETLRRAALLPATDFLADSGVAAAALSAVFSLGAASLAAPPSVALASLPLPSLALASTPEAAPSLAASLAASLGRSLGASASGRSARLRWFSLSPLKSVSYQPPPLS